jgi:hypothetical protein
MLRNEPDGEPMPIQALVGAIILFLSPTAQSEPVTNFYGRDGSYQGSAFTHGNQKTITNERGEFAARRSRTATRRHFTIATAISRARSRGRALQPIIR